MQRSFVATATLGLALTAGPVLAGTGAGKITGFFVDARVNNPLAKPIGKVTVKPADAVAGKVPTGGGVSIFKFFPAIDAIHPGLTTGDYVLRIETGATPASKANVQTYIRFHFDATLKTTAFEPSPDTTPGSPTCGGSTVGVNTAKCSDPIALGKGIITNYDAVGGLTLAGAFPAGLASATRTTLLQIQPADLAVCHTGIVVQGGIELQPVFHGTSSVACENGLPIGVLGNANAKPCISGDAVGGTVCP